MCTLQDRDNEDLSAGVTLLGMCDDRCDNEDYEEEEYDVEEDVEADGVFTGDVFMSNGNQNILRQNS